MNLLKSIWRKLFGVKTGAYDSDARKFYNQFTANLAPSRPAYDPSQDPDRIMQGEFESYFD